MRVARWLAKRVYALRTPGRWRAEDRWREAVSSSQLAARDEPLYAMYAHLARFWVEVLFARRYLRESSWRRFVAVEKETELQSLAAGRGCLLTTAYFGNPALAAIALGQIFRPVHVVVDLLNQPELRAWQKELYHHRWVRPIVRDEAAVAVPTVLRAGGAVLMIAENERPHGRAVAVPFLGRVLRVYPTLGRLSRWFNVPVGVVTCRRNIGAKMSLTLSLHEVIQPCLDDDTTVRHALSVLERVILTYPDQYYWSIPVIRKESGSAPCPSTRRTGSASRTPSMAGNRPGSWVDPAEPGPTESDLVRSALPR